MILKESDTRSPYSTDGDATNIPYSTEGDAIDIRYSTDVDAIDIQYCLTEGKHLEDSQINPY